MTRSDGRLVIIEWDGRRRPRVDVIRELHASGVRVADIARRLGVAYQTVYMAVKPQEVRLARPIAWEPRQPRELPTPDAVLIGCVSQKHDTAMPARKLYRSELFRRRRLWAEASGKPWWIVSAEYGLVHPDEIIEPYDTRIAAQPLAVRQRIAAQVAGRLEEDLGSLAGTSLELHAGDEYYQAVAPTLRAKGATVFRPLEGLRFGEQLAWYGDHLDLTGTGSQPAVRPPMVSAETLIGDARGIGRKLTELFMAGALDLSARSNHPPIGWMGMPEVRATTELRQADADDTTIRLFLTFNAAMDRARDADLLADAAVRMWRAEPWTFQPEELQLRPLGELSDVLRRYGVSQRHGADAFAWRIIGESLRDPTVAPATRSAIHEGKADAIALRDEVTSATPDGTQRFPLLGGPKISALWIRLLAYPGRATISSLESVPVAVDVQVRKVTEYLGVTDTGGLPLEDVRYAIQQTWARDVASHGAAGPDGLEDTPGALDPALWFYAKWGCTFCQSAKQKRPISPVCEQCRFPATK